MCDLKMTLKHTILYLAVLACCLSVSLSTGVTTLVYKVQIDVPIEFHPTKSDFVFNFDVLLKPSNDSTVNHIFLKNVNFFIKTEDCGVISPTSCKLMAQIKKDLEIPFIASYENGLFKYIRVSNDDSAGSEMVKMYLATYLQINMAKLLDENSEKFSYDTNEYYFLGNVDQHCDVTKRNVSDGSVFDIKKTIDMTLSDEFVYGPVTIQDGSCNSLSNAEFEFGITDKPRVLYSSSMTGIVLANLQETINYKPWKCSDKMLSAPKTLAAKLLPSIKTSLTVDLNDENSRKVTKFANRIPNAALANVTGNDGLVGIYRALDCSGQILKFFAHFYELALLCQLDTN